MTDRPKTFTIACVVDAHPRFRLEMILWSHCVLAHLPRARFRPLVYFVNGVQREMAAWLEANGIGWRVAQEMAAGSPHCNKIAPLLDAHDTDGVIVTDSDLFFVRDPSDLLASDGLRAAPNNHCNPPDFIFKNVLRASGLGRPYRPGMALYRGFRGLRETHVNNISAGIVAMPAAKAPPFAARWVHWAQWLVANRHLLATWSVHVDQVGFTLAAEEAGEDVEFLPPQINAILHSLEEMSSVYAFHLTPEHIPSYPRQFNPDRTMNPDGFAPGVADSIERLNDCIELAKADILTLKATRDHLEYFLNPLWIRQSAA